MLKSIDSTLQSSKDLILLEILSLSYFFLFINPKSRIRTEVSLFLWEDWDIAILPWDSLHKYDNGVWECLFNCQKELKEKMFPLFSQLYNSRVHESEITILSTYPSKTADESFSWAAWASACSTFSGSFFLMISPERSSIFFFSSLESETILFLISSMF